MNQRDFIRLVARNTGQSATTIEEMIEIIVSTMGDVLLEGEKLSITKLGTFKLKERKERIGYDPYHQRVIDIPSRKRITFEANKYMKEKLDFDGK